MYFFLDRIRQDYIIYSQNEKRILNTAKYSQTSNFSMFRNYGRLIDAVFVEIVFDNILNFRVSCVGGFF